MAYVFNNEDLTFVKKVQEYEKIIQYNFNISNVNLLKTGFFGSLINIMAFTSVDIKQYYLKLFQEFHPALATDFNSMLFHASFYNVNIKFATPATFNVYFEIPKMNIDNAYYYRYTILKNSQFYDKNGYSFVVPENIEINISKDKIEAYSLGINGKKKLNAFLTTSKTGQEVFLIEYNNLKQKSVTFKKIVVPNYDFGTSFMFDINIDDYRKISKISVWINENKQSPIDINILERYDDEEITKIFNLKPMNVKYYTFGSSKFDYDIFLNIQKSLITFSTGNGIYGKKLDEGDEIIIKIETTEGEQGNFQYIEFAIPNVYVTQIDLNKNESTFTTILNGFSIEAGYGGKSIEEVQSVRNKIFEQLQIRNSIVTERDFELAFKKNDSYPFIDSKFIDNKSIVFIFNALKYNNKVIETTSLNLTEDQLANNPFYPEINYQGKTLISPFYYKRENNNVTRAYIVNADIKVPLFTSPSSALVKLENNIELHIKYDFANKKSYIKLENTHDKYTYKLSCNQFNIELNYGNNFTWEVDKIYTDSFCIIKDYLYNFVIDIYDDQGTKIMTWFNYYSNNSKYHQLEPIQDFYKFFKKIPPVNYDFQTSTVVVDYLEDQLADITSTVEELYQPLKEGELPYILRMPFIDKDFYVSLNYNDFYSLIRNHFTVFEHQDQFSITTKVQQAFYDTIYLNPEYKDIIFEHTNIDYDSPKIPVLCKIIVDRNYLALSEYNQYELEFNIKLDLINLLLKKEGFQITFFESEIEKYIIDKYNSRFKIIKNIELRSPQYFKVRNSDEIYNLLTEKFDIKNAIEFIPPYFYFDYDNLKIDMLID